MNLQRFTGPQREAMLDLALLGMYVDGHLASAEDERVHRLLSSMGIEAESDQGRHYDAAVTRVRGHTQTAVAARTHAVKLAGCFTTAEQRRDVIALLDDLLASDREVAPEEKGFLAVVREAFQM